MSASMAGFTFGFPVGLRTYYFRKLSRYIAPGEYRHVREVRAQTNPQITLPELLFLRWGIKKARPETVVEIGSFCGASTTLIADQLRRMGKGKVYAIDLFSKSGPDSSHSSGYWKIFDRTLQPYQGWFEKIEGNSKEVPWSRAIDFLFIDGDHSDEGVSSDITKYSPLLRKGGYLFLHDYVDVPENRSMVKTAVDRTLLADSGYLPVGLVASLIGFRKTRA